MTQRPVPGLTYQHAKTGKFYLVSHIAKDEATDEEVVLYFTTSSGHWTRRLSSWMTPVEIDGVKQPRFKLAASYYAASRLGNADMVKALHTMMRDHGWSPSYDWTVHGSVRGNADLIAEAAKEELRSVRAANVVIVLLPGGRGTHVELGAALALEKPVLLYTEDRGLLSFDERTSVFYHHHGITRVEVFDQIPQYAVNAIANRTVNPTLARARAYDAIEASYRVLMSARDENSARIQELRSERDAAFDELRRLQRLV
jgi:nucleoside 2-deoxyribosyltransferase